MMLTYPNVVFHIFLLMKHTVGTFTSCPPSLDRHTLVCHTGRQQLLLRHHAVVTVVTIPTTYGEIMLTHTLLAAAVAQQAVISLSALYIYQLASSIQRYLSKQQYLAQQAASPPSTGKETPLMREECSLRRNTTAFTTSSSWVMRRSGMVSR